MRKRNKRPPAMYVGNDTPTESISQEDILNLCEYTKGYINQLYQNKMNSFDSAAKGPGKKNISFNRIKGVLEHLMLINFYIDSYQDGTILGISDAILFYDPDIPDISLNINDVVQVLYLKPLKEMPLYMKHPLLCTIAIWRLKNNK